MAQYLDRQQLRQLWELALAEDGFPNDVTCQVSIEEDSTGTARVVAREAGVFAGVALFQLLGEAYAHRLTVKSDIGDGDRLKAGTEIATLTGPLQLLLGIERTMLNFLQRLCGVATVTRKCVDSVAGTSARIYDTRKTIPGWRQLDKYAVRCGGGKNHRMGLHDAVLVKDNHLARIGLRKLAEAAADMIDRAGALDPPPRFIEFEVDTLEQLDALLEVPGLDVILLDNFTPSQLKQAVKRRDATGLAGRLHLEYSGNATPETVADIAATGVDRISVGALTHSVSALDIAMEIESDTI